MQLRAFAGSPGSFADAFSIGSGVQRIDVRFGTDSDQQCLTSMVLSTAYDLASRASAGRPVLTATRPLAIELRRVNAVDRRAKSDGLSLEWQAGDPAFDDRVYVSTPTSEPQVLAAVLNPASRAAVLQLMHFGFGQIWIDADGALEARAFAEHLKSSGELDRADRVVAAFRQLAANVPPLQHSGQKRPPPPLAGWSTALYLIGGAGWVTNVGGFSIVTILLTLLRKSEPELSTLPILGCLVLGLALGFYGGRAYGRLVGRLAAGRSDAHSLVISASMRGFAGISVIVFYASYVVLFLTSPSARP